MPACLVSVVGGSRAWGCDPDVCFPCVRVVSQPGALDSSAVGMNRVLALGWKRWVVDTAGGYFGRQSQGHGQTSKAEWACIFQRLVTEVQT